MSSRRSIRQKRFALIASLAIAAILLLFLWLAPRDEPSGTSEPASAVVPAPSGVAAPVNASGGQERAPLHDTAAAPVAADYDDVQASPEVGATRSMIAAHAPLRVPAVVDPDSPENKAVLQQMLTQILAPPRHLMTPEEETVEEN